MSWSPSVVVVVVHHEVSGSYMSRTIWRRIAKYHKIIHAGRFYSRSGYGVTSYFRLAVIAKQALARTPTVRPSDPDTTNYRSSFLKPSTTTAGHKKKSAWSSRRSWNVSQISAIAQPYAFSFATSLQSSPTVDWVAQDINISVKNFTVSYFVRAVSIV